MKRFIAVVLVFFLTISMFGISGYGLGISAPQQFALNEISRISLIPISINTWSSNTHIDTEYILYDFDDNPNGYIYTLSTTGQDSGYIQIDYIDGQYLLHSYSYTGTNELFHLLKANETAKTLSAYSANASTPKVYYDGGMGYLIEQGGELIDLLSGQPTSLTKAELAALDEDKNRSQQTTMSSAATGSKMITQFDEFGLVEMNDFAGQYIYGGHRSLVNNHCAPTAATNVMKYYAQFLGNSPLYYSDWYTFRELYLKMDTNDVNQSEQILTGTYWDVTYCAAYSGILEYISDRGVSLEDSYRYAWGALTGVNMSSITEQLDQNRPVVLRLNSYSGTTGNHDVVALGYIDNMIMITNGWDKYFHFYTYSNLNVYQYYYVAFSNP